MTTLAPAQPHSLKYRQFTQLYDLKDKVLTEDYVYGAFETWKIKGKTTTGGKIDYKGKIKAYNKELESQL
jgi:hypothetical protein